MDPMNRPDQGCLGPGPGVAQVADNADRKLGNEGSRAITTPSPLTRQTYVDDAAVVMALSRRSAARCRPVGKSIIPFLG
jgi:hypothetical protein